MTALAAGLVFAILGYLLGRQWLDNRRRSRALREASGRPPSDWRESCRKIASLSRCPPEEIERIWKALSDHYGIEADKVSIDDTLGGVLKDVFAHPDYELMFVLPALTQVLDDDKPSPKTWGELVAWMWWHERRARAKADGAQIGAYSNHSSAEQGMNPATELSLVIDPGVKPVFSREFHGILDVDPLGSIIGVEILSPAHHWGVDALANVANVNPPEPVISVRWDRDVDTMYVRLLPEETRSVQQRHAKGIAWFGGKGRVCKFDIFVEATRT